MAVNRVPVLKRCRSFGMDPIYLGINKKSNRQLKRANRKMSEYGLQLREKQKAKFIYGVLDTFFCYFFCNFLCHLNYPTFFFLFDLIPCYNKFVRSAKLMLRIC